RAASWAGGARRRITAASPAWAEAKGTSDRRARHRRALPRSSRSDQLRFLRVEPRRVPRLLVERRAVDELLRRAVVLRPPRALARPVILRRVVERFVVVLRRVVERFAVVLRPPVRALVLFFRPDDARPPLERRVVFR